MPISTKLLAGGLAGAALLLSAGAALAEPGEATASVNVRSGPGPGYAVLDTLYPGEGVDIQRCDGGWCYVVHNGPDGWVSANYLAPEGGGYAPPPPPPPTVIYEQPEYVPPPIIVTPGYHHRPPPYHHWGGNPPPQWPPHQHWQPGDHDNHHGWPGQGSSPSNPPPPPPRSSGEQQRSEAWCNAYPKLCVGTPYQR